MFVEVQVTIRASRPAIWAAISDIENAAEIVRGIDRIEIVEKPAHGLVGLRWRETRMLFGKPATAEKWITEAVENERYRTRAESDGFVFDATLRIAEAGGGLSLVSSHDSVPQTFGAKLMSLPMKLLFKGVAVQALLKDLDDYRSAAERA